MRILIIGAGIAGLTLANLLQQRGLEAQIIEKQAENHTDGYVMGLYPIGSNILHGLHLYQDYLDASVNLKEYALYDCQNQLLKSYYLASISEQFGAYQLLKRDDLLNLLSNRLTKQNIRYQTEVKQLTQDDNQVEVILNNSGKEIYDLVVAADGLHSNTRNLIGLETETSYFETGWGGWLWWIDKPLFKHQKISEYWGKNKFLGIYPAKDKASVIAATPIPADLVQDAYGRKDYIFKQFSLLMDPLSSIFKMLPNDNLPMYFWQLKDARAKQWIKGRVLLLGDAGCAFLPTAGIGASMAMESAAVLNDELSRTSKDYLDTALKNYIHRRKKRLIKAQTTSRKLARWMFMKSSFKIYLRNKLIPYYSLDIMLKGITKNFTQPI